MSITLFFVILWTEIFCSTTFGSSKGLQISSSWPMKGRSASRNGYSPFYSQDLYKAPYERWKFLTSISTPVSSSAAIDNVGNIYVGSSDGYVYSLTSSGTMRWKFKTGSDIVSSPAISNSNIVYVGGNDNFLYGIKASSGEMKCSYKARNQIISSPAIHTDGTVYFSSFDQYVYAIADGSCQLKWKRLMQGPLSSSPSIGLNGVIYIGSENGYMSALNGKTGTLIWQSKHANQTGDAFKSSSACISRDGKSIYIGTYFNTLCAFNALTGSLTWQYQLSPNSFLRSSPSLGLDGTIYIGSYDNFLYSISPNGELNWKYKTVNEIYSSPIIMDSLVIFGSRDRRLYGLDLSGQQIWYLPLSQLIDASPAISSTGDIIISTMDGYVHAVRISMKTCPRGTYWQAFDAFNISVQCTSNCLSGTGVGYYLRSSSTGSTSTSIINSQSCNGCSPGYYQDGSVSKTLCNPCLNGTYSGDYGSAFCFSSCPPGYESSGNLPCSLCPPGTYSSGKPINNNTIGIPCQPCPTGLYSGQGATTCSINCPIYTRKYKARQSCLGSGLQESSPWPAFGKNSGHLGQSIFRAALSLTPYSGTGVNRNIIYDGPTAVWINSLSAGVQSSLVISADNIVIFGTGDGLIYFLDGDSSGYGGVNIYPPFATQGAVSSTPSIGRPNVHPYDSTVTYDDSLYYVYVGSTDGYVYCLRKGVAKWKFATGGAVTASANVGFDGTVFVGSADGYVYALHGLTGVMLWRVATGPVSSSVAIKYNEAVFVGSTDSFMYAIDYYTGEVLWKYQTKGSILSSPTLSTDCSVLYFGSNDKNLYAIFSTSGTNVFGPFATYNKIVSTPALLTNGNVVFGSDDGLIYCISWQGYLVWSKRTEGPVVASPTIGSNDVVYIGSTMLNLYAINGSDGSVLWTFPTRTIENLPSGWRGSAAIGSDGTIYAGGLSGMVYALNLDSPQNPNTCPSKRVTQPFLAEDTSYRCNSSCPAGYGVPISSVVREVESITQKEKICDLCTEGFFQSGGGTVCLRCSNGDSSYPGSSSCFLSPSSFPSSRPSIGKHSPTGQPSGTPSTHPSAAPTSSFFGTYAITITQELANVQVSDISSNLAQFSSLLENTVLGIVAISSRRNVDISISSYVATRKNAIKDAILVKSTMEQQAGRLQAVDVEIGGREEADRDQQEDVEGETRRRLQILESFNFTRHLSTADTVSVSYEASFLCCLGGDNVTSLADAIYRSVYNSVSSSQFLVAFQNNAKLFSNSPFSMVTFLTNGMSRSNIVALSAVHTSQPSASPCGIGLYNAYGKILKQKGVKKGVYRCLPCDVGYYKDEPYMPTCSKCEIGSYADKLGSIQCTKCPWPTTTIYAGESSCSGMQLSISQASMISFIIIVGCLYAALVLYGITDISEGFIFFSLTAGSTLSIHTDVLYLLTEKFYSQAHFSLCFSFIIVSNAFFIYDIFIYRQVVPRLIFPVREWFGFLIFLEYKQVHVEERSIFPVQVDTQIIRAQNASLETMSPSTTARLDATLASAPLSASDLSPMPSNAPYYLTHNDVIITMDTLATWVLVLAQLSALVIYVVVFLLFLFLYPAFKLAWFVVGLWLSLTKLFYIDRIQDVWLAVWTGSYKLYFYDPTNCTSSNIVQLTGDNTDVNFSMKSTPRYLVTKRGVKLFLVHLNANNFQRCLMCESLLLSIPQLIIQFTNSTLTSSLDRPLFLLSAIFSAWVIASTEWMQIISGTYWQQLPVESWVFRRLQYPFFEKRDIVHILDYQLKATIVEYHRLLQLRVQAAQAHKDSYCDNCGSLSWINSTCCVSRSTVHVPSPRDSDMLEYTIVPSKAAKAGGDKQGSRRVSEAMELGHPVESNEVINNSQQMSLTTHQTPQSNRNVEQNRNGEMFTPEPLLRLHSFDAIPTPSDSVYSEPVATPTSSPALNVVLVHDDDPPTPEDTFLKSESAEAQSIQLPRSPRHEDDSAKSEENCVIT